jgi:hypothetical protein
MVGPRRQAFGQKSTNSMDFVNTEYILWMKVPQKVPISDVFSN